jgi:hypothetical protein
MSTLAYSLLEKLPEGERIVGIVVHEDCVFVATTRGVFRVQGNKLVPLVFEVVDATAR